MSAERNLRADRLHELLADEAAACLDTAAQAELLELTASSEPAGTDEYLRTAAVLQLAFLRKDPRPAQAMPAALKEQLAMRGKLALARSRPAAMPAPGARRGTDGIQRPEPRPDATRRLAVYAGLGWALAALLAVAFVVLRIAPEGGEGNLQAARSSLVEKGGDVLVLPWAPPTAAGYEHVTGDVVWSQSRQQGYLRLAGMPVNDASRKQYQLWIVDPERDAHPVDGGVFNVGTTGEAIIPIHAKLPVLRPTAFAITAEKPGGVVVSAGPLLVIAST